MKTAYPVVISKGSKYLIASVPDCKIDTQGKNIVEAIEMARDAISIWCVCEQDAGRKLPKPSVISTVKHNKGDTVTLVDVDLTAYRRKLDNRSIRKNLTIPSWLNERAEKAGVNYSQLLQTALKQHLDVAE